MYSYAFLFLKNKLFEIIENNILPSKREKFMTEKATNISVSNINISTLIF